MTKNGIRVFVAMLAVLSTVGAASGGTINWFNFDYYVYAPTGLTGGGTLIPQSGNWIIALYDASQASLLGPIADINAGLITTTQGGSWYGDGLFSSTVTSSGGLDVFTRIYSESDWNSIGSGTFYATLDDPNDGGDGTFTVAALDTQDSLDYDPGVTYAQYGTGLGEWQPVPEPTTMALFGIGLLTLAAGRRFKKKA